MGKRKGTIINYIKTNAPEIIGMQEVLNNQLIDLQSSLNEYKTVGVGREDGKTRENIVLSYLRPQN